MGYVRNDEYISVPSPTKNLSHYGRLGMKWYQHIFGKERTSSGSSKGPARKPGATKRLSIRKQKKFNKAEEKRKNKIVKELDKMSDQELDKRLKRLEKEFNYRRYLGIDDVPDVSKSRAKNAIGTVLTDSFKNIGTQAVTRFMGDSINKVANSLGYEGFYVNSAKGQKEKKD